MERKELLAVVKVLNKETDLLEKIEMEKIPVVGKGTKLEDLQENFKKVMLALDDAELIDETPEDCIDFWEEHLEEFIGEPVEEEEEKEEVEEEETEETPKKKKEGGKKKEEVKATPKKDIPKKKQSEEGTDEFGFKLGSKMSLFANAIKEKPMTMKEVKELDWNTKGASYNGTWKMLKDKGFGFKDDEGRMAIK